jgi:hypothetical protein
MQSIQKKDRSIALILEIVLGLFGIYGVGWLYSNKTNVGLSLLIGGIVWAIIAIAITVVTGGFALFCTIPVNLCAVAVSSIQLNGYINKNHNLFA